MEISAVINTYNEEKNIVRCLHSINPYVDEIILVDMGSTDKTRQLAKKYTKRIYKHPYVGYVEPARNFAINKAKGDWVLLLDADEVVQEGFGLQLRKLISQEYSFYRVARKNIMFGKWIEHTGWWPDYQIRFFKKGSVTWSDEIHSIPITTGTGTDMPDREEWALVHYHYTDIDQYLSRLLRYTTIEADALIKKQTPFDWKDLIIEPSEEFLRRFFMQQGYKDGVHGLALSLLQAFSMLIVGVKWWQRTGFVDDGEDSVLDQTMELLTKTHRDSTYWYHTMRSAEEAGMQKIITKLRAKVRL